MRKTGMHCLLRIAEGFSPSCLELSGSFDVWQGESSSRLSNYTPLPVLDLDVIVSCLPCPV